MRSKVWPWLPCSILALACSPYTGGLGSDGADDDAATGTSTGTEGDCVAALGCACTENGFCEPGLICEAGTCVPEGGDGDPGDGDPGDGDPGDGDPGDGDPGDGDGDPGSCGDQVVDPGEDCDDGDAIDGDGCQADCTHTAVSVFAGGVHTCALIEGGAVRCWGSGLFGSLGYGTPDDVGDDEVPAIAGDVTFPGRVTALDLGGGFGCARFDDNLLRCWGAGNVGQLGNASVEDLGDDEALGMLASIAFNGAVASFSTGDAHSCAILDNGEVRCWGLGTEGRLGTVATDNIGDDEGANAGVAVDLGPSAPVLVAAGGTHSCALNTLDELYCWGRGDRGQLGYASNQDVGDGETPLSMGPVDVYPANVPADTPITGLALGKEHSCVLFASGHVLCWGHNNHGQLGRANTSNWGDGNGEAPAALDALLFPSPVTALSAGEEFTCALLDNGEVRCWGRNHVGQLGRGDIVEIGNDELAVDASVPVDLGGRAIQISCGRVHACAVLEDQTIRCWGDGTFGRLGYGDVELIGDDEVPSSVGPVQIF